MKHAERKAMDRELKRKKLSSALQANIISKVGGHGNDARFRGFMMDITFGLILVGEAYLEFLLAYLSSVQLAPFPLISLSHLA